MVTCLSVLSNLETLRLEFQSSASRPDRGCLSLPPPKRSILPALTIFRFEGVTEYLEELVAYIDTPQLIQMDISFFNEIKFDCPRLAQYINCTPTLGEVDGAHVKLGDITGVVLGSQKSGYSFGLGNLRIFISYLSTCRELNRELSSIEQVCNSSLPLLSMVEDLYIEHRYWIRYDAIRITPSLWLALLLLSTSVKNLYLAKAFAPGIADALQELVETRITGVLPSLQNISVEGPELSRSFQEKLDISLLRDSFPVTLSPFLLGTRRGETTGSVLRA